MTLTSAVGSGVTTGSDTITYAATIGSFTNPAWVVGTRTYYAVSYASGTSAPYPGSLVSYESQFAGATGRLRNIFEDSETNIVASINSTTSIARLVYEFDMNPDNDVSNPTIRFSFAAVPEPSMCASLLAGLFPHDSRHRPDHGRPSRLSPPIRPSPRRIRPFKSRFVPALARFVTLS